MDKEKLKFMKSHEWIEAEGATRKVGISEFAQGQLGDIVFVEFLDLVEELGAGDEACVVESCKATASVYAPLSGKIKSYNQSLVDEPELINQSPYENGWLFEIEVADGVDESALMDYEAYQRSCDKEG